MTAVALLHFRASFVTLGRYVDMSKKMENLVALLEYESALINGGTIGAGSVESAGSFPAAHCYSDNSLHVYAIAVPYVNQFVLGFC
jgi:hypothetical protein